MKRSSILLTSVLSLVALSHLLCGMTTPASAQESARADADISDTNVRDLLRDWVRDRPDRRDMLMGLLEERRERRGELVDRLQDRRELRGELRGRARERISSRWGDEEDEYEEDDGWRGRVRERLAKRQGGDCHVITRSLRNEDRTLLVVVRRRVCRD